ncbi:MAG TPA: glycosyltransferase family 2 protein, partial [Bacteroidota bacterium]|nr:glycosyltransferase family 2 protein [Bacteroidota bacterium]
MKLSQPGDAGRVCAVIPTRNRPESLLRLLRSLSEQSHRPEEVIVIDASDEAGANSRLRGQFPSLNLRVITSRPSLSAQRNQGIALADTEFILLADDDIEFPPMYIEVLLRYLQEHPVDGAVSGTLREPANGREFVPDQRAISAAGLLWAYVFQTSV